jgi:hypothetical protein
LRVQVPFSTMASACGSKLSMRSGNPVIRESAQPNAAAGMHHAWIVPIRCRMVSSTSLGIRAIIRQNIRRPNR